MDFKMNPKKVKDALDCILAVNKNYKRPAFMCSFGKDSMVLLHLLGRGFNLPPPVIFHRDPWWPKKYAFADRIIAEWGLRVYDYPPVAVTLWEGEGIMAFTNHYQTGNKPGAILQLPKNIVPPSGPTPWLCGLRDVLARPTGTFNYPWDCVIVGHKSSDEDQIAGKIPLNCDFKLNYGIGPDAAFPLRNWTDADVWDYIEDYNLPMQEDRYDVKNRCEWPDKETNSDYANVCIACCDKRSSAKSVHCPLLNKEVSCIPELVPYDKPTFKYYGEENK